MKHGEMENAGIAARMGTSYRIADGLTAVAMMVMIVVAAGLGTVILGG